VNQSILYIFNVVYSTRGTQITILIEVPLEVAVDSSGHREKSEVELASLIQERFLTVFLDNVGAFLPINHIILYNLPNLAQFFANSDTTASVSVLTWFDNPAFSAHTWVLYQCITLVRIVIDFFKFTELTICKTIFDMVGQWQIVKSVLVCRFIIHFHVVVDSFFVREVEIVFLMVRSAEGMTCQIFFFHFWLSVFVPSWRDARTEWL
jgi:hypothetical protein